MKTFCSECGSELINYGEIMKYDFKTGEPIYQQKCSKNSCHTTHNYKYIPAKSFFKRFFMGGIRRCSDCGKEIRGEGTYYNMP